MLWLIAVILLVALLPHILGKLSDALESKRVASARREAEERIYREMNVDLLNQIAGASRRPSPPPLSVRIAEAHRRHQVREAMQRELGVR